MKKVDIYEELKNRIVKNEYKPGDVLNEIEISKEFGISRTPVRNAFQKLEIDRLINIVPRYGVQVSFVDFTNMKSLFELTTILDPIATKNAIKSITTEQLKRLKEITRELEELSSEDNYQKAINLDEEFHDIIISACGNIWLADTLSSLHLHTERLWHYCKEYFNDMTIFTRTFNKIIEAIELQDEEMAEQYSKEHINDFVSKIKEALF
ncbi:GntR family transcriptional regulator [Peptostreptococcus canis]|uniref:GntR family transcriptional regulator n=1 Tax=Peptostreptococcus canis TaxID=1159213 RepID=A0ABR6TK53_9FIRM|nr:GntR family transcriptional regulator [Peptostreptococcus canis]MBC2575381.1 GntR family transcriptional regulator [Peptostreptococcus canis]MBP1997436.1 DNA-binding GntR family transcriptional regulator [Peptostreptococcus canis]